MSTIAAVAIMLAVGACGGAGFGLVLGYVLSRKMDERIDHWECEIDRITAKEAQG